MLELGCGQMTFPGRSDLTSASSGFPRCKTETMATVPPHEAVARVKRTLRLSGLSIMHAVFGTHQSSDMPWRLGAGQAEGRLVKTRLAVTACNWHQICKTALLRYN